MRCLGVNKDLKRCKNKVKGLYCRAHKKQWVLVLFISIPTFIGVYAGLFQDLIKPLIYIDSEVKDKFESRQATEVMNLVDSLTNNSIYYKLFIDSLYGDCVFYNPPKCNSPYFELLSNLFMIGDVYYMAFEDLKFKTACFHLQIQEIDSAINHSGNNVYYGTSDLWVDGECKFSYEQKLFILDREMFEFIRPFYNSEYIPKRIRAELNNLLALEYRPLKMIDASAKFDKWFVLLKSFKEHSPISDKKLIYSIESNSISDNTLIYSIEDKNGNISLADFMRILSDLGSSIHKWKRKHGINPLPSISR